MGDWLKKNDGRSYAFNLFRFLGLDSWLEVNNLTIVSIHRTVLYNAYGTLSYFIKNFNTIEQRLILGLFALHL